MDFIRDLIETILFFIVPSSDYSDYSGDYYPYYCDYESFSKVCNSHVVKMVVLLAVLLMLMIWFFTRKKKISQTNGSDQSMVSGRKKIISAVFVVLETISVFMISYCSMIDARNKGVLENGGYDYYRQDLTFVSEDVIPQEISLSDLESGTLVADRITEDGCVYCSLVADDGTTTDLPMLSFDSFNEKQLLENDVKVIKNSAEINNRMVKKRAIANSLFLSVCFAGIVFCLSGKMSPCPYYAVNASILGMMIFILLLELVIK